MYDIFFTDFYGEGDGNEHYPVIGVQYRRISPLKTCQIVRVLCAELENEYVFDHYSWCTGGRYPSASRNIHCEIKFIVSIGVNTML